MAREVLEKIRMAEDDAQAIVNMAAIAGREAVLKATQKADQMIVDATLSAKESTAITLEKAQELAKVEYEAKKLDLATDIETSKKAATKNIDKATQFVLGRVL